MLDDQLIVGDKLAQLLNKGAAPVPAIQMEKDLSRQRIQLNRLVTKRADGTAEVTYDRWPLYTWVIDSAPGDVTGQDLNNLGGKWYVITAQGRVITKHL